MQDTHSFTLFVAAMLALNLTPGPDMLYIIARSSGEGAAAGVVSALGIATGALVHLAAVLLGVASLLTTVPLAYDVMRMTGAAYLIYLGVRALAARRAALEARSVPRATPGRIYRQGVITNVLNPKVALFFAAFLPQFADPSRGPVLRQLLLLGLLFNVSGTVVNLAVAWLAARAGDSMRRRVGPALVLERVTGVVFIALGLRLALQQRG
jgi:threonine/homoserine/homoserine lactone efflux protein